jgi:nucleotide-binding universal stress UspA family protein
MAIRRILVPTDFSDAAQNGLDYAVGLAKAFAAEVFLLFVVEPVYYATPADLYGASANLSMLLEEQKRIAREQIARLGRQIKRREVRFRSSIETGVPYEVITETARKQRCDLIVMATHGRTGLSHLLLGSVAEKVVRTATCPVLTVRGKPKKNASNRHFRAPKRMNTKKDQ